MNISRPSRALLYGLLAAGVLVYALVLELGLSAGRVHHGVTVDGDIEVAGLTRLEAGELLQERTELLASQPLVFAARGVGRQAIEVADIGARPEPNETAAAAMAIGRAGGPWRAFADRWTAWTGGIDIDWVGEPSRGRVSRFIEQIEERALDAGLSLNRCKLRGKIRRVATEWPREDFYRIPVREVLPVGAVIRCWSQPR
ncbi:MAG: hypothetical protein M3516_03440 [Actinomycetota bacterium]|nr:hypothetical protein [Actinomycetota bacterium]